MNSHSHGLGNPRTRSFWVFKNVSFREAFSIFTCTFETDIETAVGMLELVLDEETYPFVKPFCEFLSEQSLYKAVNKDQWSSFLEFCKTIDQDLANYDENGSCTNPFFPVNFYFNFVNIKQQGLL